MKLATSWQVKTFKVIGIFFAAIISIFIVIGVALSLNENHHKHLILNELNRIGSPVGCAEVNRQYQSSGIDASSEWFVDYHCSANNAFVYNSIAAKLKPLDYTKTQDYTADGPGIFFDFTYTSQKYIVHYGGPSNDTPLDISKKSTLDNSVTPNLSMDIQEK
jgi:hypothetical protein